MIESELTFRLATTGDADTIAQMSRRLIEQGLPWRWTPARVAASIRASHANVVVATLGERLIGFGIMGYGDHVAHLSLFAVDPEHQRTGVGRQLLYWLEECAVQAGIVAVVLEVRADNDTAQRFYESMEYRVHVRLPGYYQGREAALRMGKRLSRRRR